MLLVEVSGKFQMEVQKVQERKQELRKRVVHKKLDFLSVRESVACFASFTQASL